MTRAREAATRLAQVRLTGGLLDTLPQHLRPADEGAAYEIQDELHRQLTAAGYGVTSGHKIGCTTSVMQAYLGINSPCAGQVFAPTVYMHRGVFHAPESGRLGVECELAVTLATDLPPRSSPYSPTEVSTAIDSCRAAIEVVADRYVDYSRLETPTLIADDFFNAGAVLGAPHNDFDPDRLPEVAAMMLIDGQEVGRGAGTNVMSHPLNALAWLANNLSGRGITLKAGEFVLLGSLVQTEWVTPPAAVRIVNDALGQADAYFD